MTATKKSFSAKELRLQLGYKRYIYLGYDTWIRSVMSLRGEEYVFKIGLD